MTVITPDVCVWCQGGPLVPLLLSLKVKEIAAGLSAWACRSCGKITIVGEP